MKLIYRGSTYDYNPPAVQYGDSTQVGKYQGLDIRFRNRQKRLVLPSTLHLIYRGHTYDVNPAELQKAATPKAHGPVKLIYRGHTYIMNPENTAPEGAVSETGAVVNSMEAVPAVPSSIRDRARNLMMDHHRAVKRRQQAMLSRSNAKVGLSNQDSLYWNHIRGEVHPSFGDSYDRGHVAFS